jgi:hypothetical protein
MLASLHADDGAWIHDDDLTAPAEVPLRVIVVDDHDLFRSGLRRLAGRAERA